MAPFDPELYLRLLGERGLLGSFEARNRGFDGELSEAARALIAVGAIELPDATEIVEGYELASALRNGRGPQHFRPAPQRSPANPEPRRTVLCNVTIERPTEEIRVRSVTLSSSETRLKVLIRTPLGRRRRSSQRGPMAARFNYQVTDDRGGKSTTHFGGGGNDHEWRGQLAASQPLAMDTAWIELDGVRIELIDAVSLSTVAIETLPDGDPAHSYLWHWLASLDRHRQRTSLDPVFKAMIAAGYLDVEDPTLEVMRKALEARRQPGPRALGGSAPALIDGVPPEWQSLLHPKPNRRPVSGSIAVAAVSPPFDGIVVTADELTADANGWQIDIDVTPGISIGPYFGAPLDGLRVAWWAVDDRGQHYLGQLGQWSGGSDGLTGTLEFGPAIDRAAKTITLLPTGPTERARIEIPLDWSAG